MMTGGSSQGWRVTRILTVAWVALATAPLWAGDWPRFRGPNGQAGDPNARVPVEWSAANIRFKVELPGIGVSSPSVVGSRIFLASANENGTKRSLYAFDRSAGTRLWQLDFVFQTNDKHKKNSYATATPASDGEHVCITFSSAERYVVYCATVEGKFLWEKDLGPFVSQHGSGASPIIHGDLVIVANEQDGPSSIVAFNKKTGDKVWTSPRDADKTAYSTPFVLTGQGADQLIVSSSVGLSALDVATGTPIWNCKKFDSRVVASPFIADGLVVGNCGSGNKGHLFVAVRPDGKGDVSNTHVAWTATKTLPYCVTPVAIGPYLYMITDSGIARCVEAKTGKEVWTERLSGNFSASPVFAENRIYAVGEKGDVFVIAAAPSFKLLAKNHLDDYFLTTPAIAGNEMFLRGEKFLWCIGPATASASR